MPSATNTTRFASGGEDFECSIDSATTPTLRLTAAYRAGAMVEQEVAIGNPHVSPGAMDLVVSFTANELRAVNRRSQGGTSSMAKNDAVIDKRVRTCFLWIEVSSRQIAFKEANISVPASYQKRIENPSTE